MQKLQTIILAGGKGTRLNNGSASPIPKVLYKVSGKPMIFYLLETLKKMKLGKPFLIIGYKAETVKDTINERANYILQKEQLGTGHAVKIAKNELVGKSQYALVLCGDMPFLTQSTLRRLINTHCAQKPAISLLSIKFDDPNYYMFGRIVYNNKNKIQKIVEQKNASDDEKKIKICNSAIYMFDAQFLWNNVDKIQAQPNGEYYLTDLVEIAIGQNKKVIEVKSNNTKEFLGINTLDHLKEAQQTKV